MLTKAGAIEEKVVPVLPAYRVPKPMPSEGVDGRAKTAKEFDEAYTMHSELWGRREPAALGRNAKKKMPIQYGATLHACSADGTDPSFRAH